MTALSCSNTPYEAVISSPSGLCTRTSLRSPFNAAKILSTVPSPPSASGNFVTAASGNTLWTAFSITLHKSLASIEPLNESGATTIFIFLTSSILLELDLQMALM